jgi:hypothetical protein
VLLALTLPQRHSRLSAKKHWLAERLPKLHIFFKADILYVEQRACCSQLARSIVRIGETGIILKQKLETKNKTSNKTGPRQSSVPPRRNLSAELFSKVTPST